MTGEFDIGGHRETREGRTREARKTQEVVHWYVGRDDYDVAGSTGRCVSVLGYVGQDEGKIVTERGR
ncbi:hypothetical protein HYG81_26695 (plasmid) [Natrinema zhouii]|uniref:hypothetical protein n=1 Tax=Natrinema zhouii TaxID=1710539 RepID=UPI001CFFBD5A|nr:hypothetical protein [Natrinema zhouii]UHQ99219.1 hypothetical protein HYG81_26695 [Natrinema zhouii]